MEPVADYGFCAVSGIGFGRFSLGPAKANPCVIDILSKSLFGIGFRLPKSFQGQFLVEVELLSQCATDSSGALQKSYVFVDGFYIKQPLTYQA